MGAKEHQRTRCTVCEIRNIRNTLKLTRPKQALMDMSDDLKTKKTQKITKFWEKESGRVPRTNLGQNGGLGRTFPTISEHRNATATEQTDVARGRIWAAPRDWELVCVANDGEPSTHEVMTCLASFRPSCSVAHCLFASSCPFESACWSRGPSFAFVVISISFGLYTHSSCNSRSRRVFTRGS